MADEGQAGRDAADQAATTASEGAAGARGAATATAERIGTRSSAAQTEADWSRGWLVGTSDGKMPTPWFRKWGWWMLPLLLIAAIGATFWAIDHVEDDIVDAAPRILEEAGVDPSGLEFDADWRNVEVTGVLPAGVTAAEVEQILEDGLGPAEKEDIRAATVLAQAAAPAPLGEIAVRAIHDGTEIVLQGNVPSEAHADALVAAAEESGLPVRNELTVSVLEPSASDPEGQIGRLAAVLPALGAGVISADLFLSDDDLTGTIDAADAASAATLGGLVGSGVAVSAPDPLGNLDVSATYDGSTIVLDGDVLSEAHSAELEAAAASVVGAGNVTNNLNVLGLDEAVEGSDAKVTALAASLAAFGGLESGDASMNDTDLTVNGVAVDEDARAALDAAVASALDAGLRPGGDLTVVEPPPGPSLQEEIDLLQAELDSLQDEIRENVVFGTDSAELSDLARSTLDKVVAAMDRYQRPVVETGGHTDSQASDAYNLDLSQRRSNSVVAYLIEQGIDEGRLRAVGYGESQPIADNTTEAGRLQNRRVEFTARESF